MPCEKNESDLEYSRHLQLQKWEKGSIISTEGSQYLLGPGLIYRQEKYNHPKAAVWEYSGVCSFRHVDCQKFLIRAIIKELRRLFSTESHCLIAGYTHTEYRWRMCLVGLCLHSNRWQPHRNLPVRHVMCKPKKYIKNQHESACENKCVYSFLKRPNMHYFHQRKQIHIFHRWLPVITHFKWMGLLGFVEGFLWFVYFF